MQKMKILVIVCTFGVVAASFTIFPQTASACFAYTLSCEGKSYHDYDGGSEDVEYHSINPAQVNISSGGSHTYKVTFSYSPGCGNRYSGKFFVIQRGPVSPGWTYKLTDSASMDISGKSYSFTDTGNFIANLEVKSPSSAPDGERAELSVRLWSNDTDACNEHNTLDVITTTVAQGGSPAPLTLYLTSPNGGEILYIGLQSEVKWTAYGGTSPITVDLDYSNTGSTGPWKFIASTLPNTGVYLWTVPPGASTDCLVRVTARDSASGTLNDTSNGVFTVTWPPPSVSITSPGWYVKMTAGTVYNIKWKTSMGCPPLSVDLSYSISSHIGPWITVAINETDDGSFDWIVPNTPAGSAYFKAIVHDSFSPSQSGDGVSPSFEIVANSSVTSPIIWVDVPWGDESWENGTKHNIKWTTIGTPGNTTVSLDYSTNGNTGPWTSITTGQPDYGSYSWTVPHAPSPNCYVRATVFDSATSPPMTSWDTNDYAFEIFDKGASPPIQVRLTRPNGGENWTHGYNYSIGWTATGGAGSLRIDLQYSVSGTSGPWIPISENETNDGTYTWSPPNITATDCFIKATAKDSSTPPETKSDINDAAFYIKPSGGSSETNNTTQPLYIYVISPNGGETWNALSSHNVKWNASGGNGTVLIDLYFSMNGTGGPWNAISLGEVNDGEVSWILPNISSLQCLVKAIVIDTSSPPQIASDLSNSTFTITNWTLPDTPPKITVISPNGGEVLKNGTVVDILWNATDERLFPTNAISLMYSTDNGFNWVILHPYWNNTGTYPWTIPDNVESTECLVRIYCVDSADHWANDTSDSPFTIIKDSPGQPLMIWLKSPNGGEKFSGGGSAKIEWISSGGTAPRTIKLEYCNVGTSGPWTLISSGEMDDGAFTWSNVPDITSSLCTVKATVTDSSVPVKSTQDMSNATFTIISINNGTVRGTATNTSGAILVGATVRVMSNELVITSATTDSAGTYSINLAPGEYTLNSSAAGHYYSSNVSLTIASGEEVVQNFELRPLKSSSGGGNGGSGGGSSSTGMILGLPAMMFYMIVIVIIVVICIAVGGAAAVSGRKKKKESQNLKWVQPHNQNQPAVSQLHGQQQQGQRVSPRRSTRQYPPENKKPF